VIQIMALGAHDPPEIAVSPEKDRVAGNLQPGDVMDASRLLQIARWSAFFVGLLAQAACTS
jgi:hypothetical protein